MNETRNLGIVRVDFDTLERLLLPAGQRIEAVLPRADWEGIELRISGPGLPQVKRGYQIPLVSLVLKTPTTGA